MKNLRFIRQKQSLNYLLAIASVIYLIICGYLYLFQRNILYMPDTHMETPDKYDFSEATPVKLTTIDNLKITAWYIPPKDKKPVLLYFHGNAKNLSNRIKKFKEFSNAGFGLLAVSYRGYGDSEGLPTEEGLYNDARAAIKYLLSRGIKENNIIAYGESLGTGVAVQMALEYNFRAIALEAPYVSIYARAAELYPYIPIRFLLKDKFDSINKVIKIHTPVLIFHSKDDKVMPFNHGIKLFHACNEPKKMAVFESYGHSKFNARELADIMSQFINNN